MKLSQVLDNNKRAIMFLKKKKSSFPRREKENWDEQSQLFPDLSICSWVGKWPESWQAAV
jgi:hypothetical protein